MFDGHIILAEGDSNNFKRTTKQIAMAQQTAVDWLEKQFDKYTSAGVNVPNDKIFKLTHKAKAMEKEQIINAFENGIVAYDDPDRINDDINFDAENYYNETYNKS